MTERIPSLATKARARGRLAHDLLGWGQAGGILWPRRFAVTWADDPGPWYVMRTDRIELNVDVDEALGRARAALAGVEP
jgi:hypothetical protein